jgi:hypothetical protein
MMSGEGVPLPEANDGLPDGSVIAVPASGQVLYRLVKDATSWQSYRSTVAVRKPKYRDNPAVLEAGISMWERLEQAKARAMRKPLLIAQVTLTEGLNFYLAKTRGDGHFTVWGDPESLRCESKIVFEEEA